MAAGSGDRRAGGAIRLDSIEAALAIAGTYLA